MMALLRPENTLRYFCNKCKGQFRLGVIEGPESMPCLTIGLRCVFCGQNSLRLLPKIPK
jgi:hypothetical protein